MHIDNLRIAILNYLVAQQRNENFLVRIEDSETEENIEGKDTEIMQILEKFALNHDSVHHQSEQKHIHQTLAIKLLEENKAFICTCPSDTTNETPCTQSCISKEKTAYAKLKEEKQPFVLRLKQPTDDIIFEDTLQGKVITTPNEIGTPVILRTDGTPTSIFASACGDMLFGITMVIQEEKYLINNAKQIHIKQQLGFDEPTEYAHLPSLLDSTKKEAEEYALVKWLFAQGYIPDAIINYLILLSNPNAPKKIFTMPEAIAWFKLENIPTEHASFKLEKLQQINREHLKRMDDTLLSTLFGFADPDVGKLVKLYLEEASTINEVAAMIKPVFAPKKFEGECQKEMILLQKIIEDAPMINAYDDFKNYLLKKSSLKEDALLTPLRLLITGTPNGPELKEIYPHIKAYLLEIAS